MKPFVPQLAAVLLLLGVPFALRPPEVVDEGEPLVVLTPHNEAIRYEFSRGFQRHMREQHDRQVRIDWRTMGGTTEITRYLASEYQASFAQHWTGTLHKRWSLKVAKSFDNPKVKPEDEEGFAARKAFLKSDVGAKVDVLFGGGSYDFAQHAAAGRLVDSQMISRHPELFGEHGIPETVGGEPYWDREGRWIGVCVSGFGICYNPQTLSRLGIPEPTAWKDLTNPRYRGQLALADPTKSGSANKAFEMLIQQRIAESVAAAPGDTGAVARGFEDALRVVRRLAGNARYFTDSAVKVPLDVASGNAAAGMCIDFYGRFQSESTPGRATRLRFVTPRGGTSLGSDPIGLLRGAPNPALSRAFIEYTLSDPGQALWGLKVGAPQGPERYALRRLPISPRMYEPALTPFRSDPDVNPYELSADFSYRAAWTAPLFRAIGFVIHVMSVDAEEELHRAWSALIRRGFPPRATALFDDVSLVGYRVVSTDVTRALASGDPLTEIDLQNRLVAGLTRQYLEVARLAEAGQ